MWCTLFPSPPGMSRPHRRWNRSIRMAASGPRAADPRPADTPLRRQLAQATTARPTALDAFRHARRIFLGGGRVNMQALARSLGVDRATLYRWVGSREQLLTEILWSLIEPTIRQLRKDASGSAGRPVTGRGRHHRHRPPRHRQPRHAALPGPRRRAGPAPADDQGDRLRNPADRPGRRARGRGSLGRTTRCGRPPGRPALRSGPHHGVLHLPRAHHRRAPRSRPRRPGHQRAPPGPQASRNHRGKSRS